MILSYRKVNMDINAVIIVLPSCKLGCIALIAFSILCGNNFFGQFGELGKLIFAKLDLLLYQLKSILIIFSLANKKNELGSLATPLYKGCMPNRLPALKVGTTYSVIS